MAKGSRTLNPADAHRKAERKKEIKKNKEARNKTREVITVKKDTGGLEAEIQRLEEAGKAGDLDKHSKEKLASLRDEVERIKKKKAEYVVAHPEHAKLVYPGGSALRHSGNAGDRPPPTAARNLFGPNGLPLHPERSIYYDERMNPFGMPPPGMPYVERPLLPHELPPVEPPGSTHGDSEEDSDDDDVPLPPGPPPPPAESDDSDDDIPMPPGLPPGAGSTSPFPLDVSQGLIPPPPLGPPPPQAMQFPPSPFPPFPPGVSFPPPPPLPPGFAFPPQGPFGFVQPIPPPPPGFPPRSAQAIQDPLSPVPHQTYQQHRAIRQGMAPPPPHSAPPNPSTLPPLPLSAPTPPTAATRFNQATISAEPELRDLKRESTAFVPTAVKRRKTATVQRVNAAPPAELDGTATEQFTVGPERPDLMAALRHAGVGSAQGPVKPAAKAKDDYDNFSRQ